jgi:hypothetical protein
LKPEQSSGQVVAPPGEQDLERFRESGDPESLLLSIQAQGKNQASYADALNQLQPVFEALKFGLRPLYKDLNSIALQRRMAEVTAIVAWMAGSQKADMKTIAIELMGHLGWQSFRPLLELHAVAPQKWEQLTAIAALGQVASEWAKALLGTIAESNPDAEVRAAAQRALHMQ